MSHLTYKQKRSYINAPFFGFIQSDLTNVQVNYYSTKSVKSTVKYTPIHIEKIRGYCQLDSKITLTQLVEHLLCYKNMLKNSKFENFKGYVKQTVEYLEKDGFLRFLPDTDGELTFCNYRYFKEINGEG